MSPTPVSQIKNRVSSIEADIAADDTDCTDASVQSVAILEDVLQSELHNSRVLGCGHFSKERAVEGRHRIIHAE